VNWEELEIGCTVGWWALAINPATYTPENLLTLARVVFISQTDDKVAVQPIPRPGTSMISFGGVLDDEEPGDGENEETFAWRDIINAEWRLVRN